MKALRMKPDRNRTRWRYDENRIVSSLFLGFNCSLSKRYIWNIDVSRKLLIIFNL